MNPLTKVKLINELNEREAELGVQDKVSWHAEYSGSAWVFVGGLPYELTEGDIICVFSQYGEIVNINLVRDKKTGKSKGFCFICYEDQRSTILAVDNFNGIKIKGRTIRVDHVANYRPPKDSEDVDEITKAVREKGCGVKTPPQSSAESSEEDEMEVKRHKKEKKKKKKKKKEKREHRKRLKEEPGRDGLFPKSKIKVEKENPDYERYAGPNQETWGSTSGHQHQSRMPPGQELRYESGVEPSGGSERDRYERRMPPRVEKQKKTEAIKDRQPTSESRSRDRSKNRDKPSREKSPTRY
ncbi:RNA-binding motif protein, X-linked 2 [Vipera latastei]